MRRSGRGPLEKGQLRLAPRRRPTGTVLQYLWDAAADLHPTQPSRAGFVEHTARDLLDSNTAQVIAQLTTARNNLGNDTAAPGLDRAIGYLTAKQPYLHYRQALAMGWPIATGVIEGACRHLPVD